MIVYSHVCIYLIVNCQKACKKCDEGRPCQRCIKLGISDTCVDSPRKERKKGFKRGPYKKKKPLADKAIRKSRTVKASVICPPPLMSHNLKVEVQSMPVMSSVEISNSAWSNINTGQYTPTNYYQDMVEYSSFSRKNSGYPADISIVVPSHNIGSPDSPDSNFLDTIQSYHDSVMNISNVDAFPFSAVNHNYIDAGYSSYNNQYKLPYNNNHIDMMTDMNHEMKNIYSLYDNTQHISLASSGLIHNPGDSIAKETARLPGSSYWTSPNERIYASFNDNRMTMGNDTQWIKTPIIPSTYAYF
ncbi:hypothetical protein BDB01DRAFT_99990 [Pilobolus umbonatus]|nr:hypothetical protein BDB01DRAFT_99990 [Pilobolus umbonatus]